MGNDCYLGRTTVELYEIDSARVRGVWRLPNYRELDILWLKLLMDRMRDTAPAHVRGQHAS